MSMVATGCRASTALATVVNALAPARNTAVPVTATSTVATMAAGSNEVKDVTATLRAVTHNARAIPAVTDRKAMGKAAAVTATMNTAKDRSEERRVGKGCRSWG